MLCRLDTTYIMATGRPPSSASAESLPGRLIAKRREPQTSDSWLELTREAGDGQPEFFDRLDDVDELR
jgi:hypothetical protein